MSMLDDLAEVFEQSAASQTSIRTIVGEDPAGFAEAFLQSYPAGQSISAERRRIASTIDEAVRNAL